MCMMFYGLSISHTLSVYYYYYVCYFFLVIVTLTFGGFLRYDTRCYFNVRSKADISQLNLPQIYRLLRLGGGICGIQTERVWVALR